jgi:hypothetical protein
VGAEARELVDAHAGGLLLLRAVDARPGLRLRRGRGAVGARRGRAVRARGRAATIGATTAIERGSAVGRRRRGAVGARMGGAVRRRGAAVRGRRRRAAVPASAAVGRRGRATVASTAIAATVAAAATTIAATTAVAAATIAATTTVAVAAAAVAAAAPAVAVAPASVALAHGAQGRHEQRRRVARVRQVLGRKPVKYLHRHVDGQLPQRGRAPVVHCPWPQQPSLLRVHQRRQTLRQLGRQWRFATRSCVPLEAGEDARKEGGLAAHSGQVGGAELRQRLDGALRVERR